MSFVCAVLVLMIHVERSADCISVNWLNATVSQIAVPFFFAVSGFLLLNRYGEAGWYRSALAKRVNSLLIPFLCLNICWFPFKYAIHYVGYIYFGADHSNPNMVFSFLNFLRAFSPIAVCGSPCVGPLWYVRALMWLVLFSPIIAWFVCKSKKICWLFMLIVMSLWAIQLAGIVGSSLFDAQAGLDYSVRCLFYFSLGMVVRRWRLSDISRKTGIISMIFGLCLSFVCLCSAFDGKSYVQTISILLMIIGLWWATPTNVWPKFFTGNSFVIFVLHTILMYLGHTTLKAVRLISYFEHGIGVWFLAFLYLMLCCVIGCLFRKHMPKLANMFFGGR